MQSHGPDRIFPPATGLLSVRRNLLSHLVRLANLRLAPGYSSGGAGDPFGQGDAYLNALQHIAELLDPGFQPSVLTTADSMRAVLKRVEELWTEIVIAEADPANATRACDYAHKLLARFPASTACYVNECANSFIEPQVALDLLAQSSRFIESPEDAVRVDRAQKHVVQVILRRKQSIPSETIPPAPLRSAIAAASPEEPFLTDGHRAALSRRTMADTPRPYSTPGYPWIPLVFLAGTILGLSAVIGSACSQRWRSALRQVAARSWESTRAVVKAR